MIKGARTLYKETIALLDEKKSNGIELTEKEKKKYRDCKYALNRLDQQARTLKLMLLITGSILIGSILGSLLPTKIAIIVICLYWLYTNYIIFMYKKDLLKEMKHVNIIWVIFLCFPYVSLMMLLNFNFLSNFMSSIIFYGVMIYGHVYAIIIYGYGKKVSNE